MIKGDQELNYNLKNDLNQNNQLAVEAEQKNIRKLVEKRIIDLQTERLEFLIDLNKFRQENDNQLREKKLEAAREAEEANMLQKLKEIKKRGQSPIKKSSTFNDHLKKSLTKFKDSKEIPEEQENLSTADQKK